MLSCCRRLSRHGMVDVGWYAPRSQLYDFTLRGWGSAAVASDRTTLSICSRSVGHPAHVECSHCGRSQGRLHTLRWRYHTGCTLGSSNVSQHIQNKPRQESKPAHSMSLKYVMTRSRCARLGPQANPRFQVFLTLSSHFASVAPQGTAAIGWKVGLQFLQVMSDSLRRGSVDAEARLGNSSVGGTQPASIRRFRCRYRMSVGPGLDSDACAQRTTRLPLQRSTAGALNHCNNST